MRSVFAAITATLLAASAVAAQTTSAPPAAAPAPAPSGAPATGAPALAPTPGTPSPGGVTQMPSPSINSTPSQSNVDLYTEVRDVVAAIFAWFTEGFDAPDLKRAKALLGQFRE